MYVQAVWAARTKIQRQQRATFQISLTLPFSIQIVLFTVVKIRFSVSEELKATFCLYDLDKKDGLSITELSDKIGQVRTIYTDNIITYGLY